MAEFAYMNSHNDSIGTTPFYLMYGYHPEVRYEVEDDSTEGEVPAANERIKKLQALRDEAAEHLRNAYKAQAKYYNKSHKPQTYKVGDLVMLATKNLKQKRPSKKLSHKYMGPFRITDKVGAQAYRLLLPSTYRIHNTFHVSLLEPYHHRECGDAPDDFMQAPELIDDDEMWEVEEIIDKVKNKEGVWYKVKWTGWGEEYNQWVPDEDILGAKDLVKAYNEADHKRKHQDKELDSEELEQQHTSSRSKRRRRNQT